MADKSRKLMKKEIETLSIKIAECDPNETYTESRKKKDKNGNDIFVECTVCPYDDLLEKRSKTIKDLKELKTNETVENIINIAKIVVPCATSIWVFYSGMEYEKNGCFTFETFKSFMRKPKF